MRQQMVHDWILERNNLNAYASIQLNHGFFGPAFATITENEIINIIPADCKHIIPEKQ